MLFFYEQNCIINIMKITINTDEKYAELELIINCNRMNDDVINLLTAIKMLDMKLIGHKDRRQYILEAKDIIYIETVDNITFIYTSTDVYENPLRLYELEKNLENMGFMRASKNCIFNIRHIQYIEPELDRRLILQMENGIKIIVSRQYSNAVRKQLEENNG